MAIAMAGSSIGSLGSSRKFCGEVEGFGRGGIGGPGLSGTNYGGSCTLSVRCGKKGKKVASMVAKVQQLLKAQRDLVLFSQKVPVGLGCVGVIGENEPEGSILIGISNPDLLKRMIKNLDDIQAEVETLTTKTEKKNVLSFSSSECGDSDMGEAMDMLAWSKSKNSAKQVRVSASVFPQTDAISNVCNSVTTAPIDTLPPAPLVDNSTNSMISQVFFPADLISIGIDTVASTSNDVQNEEPAIVAQIRALCTTVKTDFSGTTSEIYNRGPIQLKDTSSGGFFVDSVSSSLPSVAASVPLNLNASGIVEVCTVGKCRRGGAQQILAFLQESVRESADILVTPCKCMGKCKSSPNVRVKDGEGQTQLHSHVTVDDVETLVELHFGV